MPDNPIIRTGAAAAERKSEPTVMPAQPGTGWKYLIAGTVAFVRQLKLINQSNIDDYTSALSELSIALRVTFRRNQNGGRVTMRRGSRSPAFSCEIDSFASEFQLIEDASLLFDVEIRLTNDESFRSLRLIVQNGSIIAKNFKFGASGLSFRVP